MKTWIIILTISAIILAGCINEGGSVGEMKNLENNSDLKTAIFAGGCFWCMEAAFQETPGVVEAISGYTGGEEENPTYEEVGSGTTGHKEAVRVVYDPSKIDYNGLVEIFWHQIDPTDMGGQFADRGSQYKTAIFYNDEEQKKIAEESKRILDESGKFDKPVATEILPAEKFYVAEEYHQDYYKKARVGYTLYKKGSGREDYIKKTWKGDDTFDSTGEFVKPSEDELKKILTPLQYKVTQQDGTERAFDNEYWDNKEEGIYVDIVSGEPLFSSTDKYKSGTGWPSFTKPIEQGVVVNKTDFKLLVPRKEIRSKIADSHLGHLFKDGPAPTGDRYCMNSAALRFVAKEKMEEEGYGEYLELFN